MDAEVVRDASGPVPVPVSETGVLEAALSVTDKDAVSEVPGLGGVAGVNVTVIVQGVFGTTELGQLLLAE